VNWTDDPEETVLAALQFPKLTWIAWLDDTPVAAVGTIPTCPGVWSPWAFGTDDFRQVGLLLTRHVRRCMLPMMFGTGHRAETRSMEGHVDAHRWLESFGARREGVHPGAGKNGETFVTYAIVRGRWAS
jgi:hypothetical protein